MTEPIEVNPFHYDGRVIYVAECSNCPVIDKGETLGELEIAIANHICKKEEY